MDLTFDTAIGTDTHQSNAHLELVGAMVKNAIAASVARDSVSHTNGFEEKDIIGSN
jgi:hypothetical protein